MKRFAYAIWDFDGTIADSMHIWINAASDYLRFRGVEEPGEIDNIARPKGLMETVLCMKRHFHLPESPQQIFEEICERTGEQYRYHIMPKAGAEPTLEDLAAHGLEMCIATASTEEHVWAALRRWRMDKYFRFIITCDEVGEGKYSPRIYLRAAERMQARPEQTLVFEDGFQGAASARGEGFYVIGVNEPCVAEKMPELRANSDIFLESLSDWPGLSSLP